MSNPLLGSLIDPFTGGTLNAGLWNMSSGGGVNGIAAPGRAYVQVGTGYNNIGAANYNATGQAIYARVTPAVAGTGGKQVQTIFQVAVDGNNQVQIVCTPGVSFQAQAMNAGVYSAVNLPAYDPAQHAWWRLRETGGSWAVEASADGAAWTTLTTLSYSWSPASVGFYFLTHTTDGTTGGNAYLEHVNTPLGTSTLMPSWPQIRFQVAFNTGGTSTTPPAYVDLSSRLRGSWSAALAGRQYELDQVQSGQLTLTLWNGDGALDPLNTSSPYSPNVVPMRAARLQAVWPPTRNLIPQDRSTGVAPASAWYAYNGTVAPATGLAPAPTGHTTATSWRFPVTGSIANQYPLLTGTNGGNAEAMSFPVVAGQSYSWSCWVSRSSGGDTTLGITQQVLWYDRTGAQLSGAIGNTLASVPVQGTWAQNTASGTAPAGAVEARIGTWLTNTATTAVNTLYFTAMQLEQAGAPTPWTAGGVVYPLWAGFVERWPQQWNMSGTYGLVDLTCVDLLAGLAQFTLAPSFQASLQALNPDYIYAFNEASGSTHFADALGHRPTRSVSNSALGPGSGAVTAGNSLQGGGAVGVAGPVVTITNSPTGSSTNTTGKYVSASVPTATLPSSGGWTRLICFRTTAATPSGSNYLTLWASTGPGFWGGSGSQSTFIFGVDNNGHGFGWITNPANTATTSIAVPDVVVNDGNWHIIAAQLSPDGKTFTVAVDQHGYISTTTLDYHPSGLITESIGALENHYIDAFAQAFSGDVAFATQFSYQIGNTAAFDLMSGFSTGWSGETSAARAQRILNLAGYGGSIQTQGATLAMGGANFAGTDPMSALTLVGDTEAGQVYVDGAGQLWLTGRLWRYLQTSPTVTFGENAGEVPYLGDVAVDFDTTHIYNAAQVTQVVSPGFPQPPVQPGTNTASQQAYLPRTVQRSINTQDQTLQLAAAQYLVSQYGQPLPRLAALNVDPASNPALWSTVLGLGFGTRAQVNRRPPAGPGAAQISVQQFVEHLTWTGDDQGNLKLALQLTPAAPYLNWGVVASLHTTVQVGVPSGQSTLTLGALTGAATNPAAAVLAPGTVLTVGYGTANAENLTVKSVGATSPGYAAVAVTFTTSTVNPHNLNEVACQPLPGGYQLPAATAAGFPASLDGGATISATGPRAAY